MVEVGVVHASTRGNDTSATNLDTTAALGTGVNVIAGNNVSITADATTPCPARAVAYGGGIVAAKIADTYARADPIRSRSSGRAPTSRPATQ